MLPLALRCACEATRLAATAADAVRGASSTMGVGDLEHRTLAGMQLVLERLARAEEAAALVLEGGDRPA